MGSRKAEPAGQPEPVDIIDRLMWRDAQQVMLRHSGPDPAGDCVWCGAGWPCPPRELAERAASAAGGRNEGPHEGPHQDGHDGPRPEIPAARSRRGRGPGGDRSHRGSHRAAGGNGWGP